LVRGAAKLAIEICGQDTPKNRRRVYYVASLPDNPFGLFKIGDALCGRKQRLRSVGLSTCVAIALIILFNLAFNVPARATTLPWRPYQDHVGSGLGLLGTWMVAVTRAKHASPVLSKGGSTTASSRLDTITVHPAADLFPMMSDAQPDLLSADIAVHGLLTPFEMIIDRDGTKITVSLNAPRSPCCVRDLNSPPHRIAPDQIAPIAATEKDEVFDPYAYAMSTNYHRRHLNTENKRQAIQECLKARPRQSDPAVATVDHKAVAAIRAEAEGHGEIPALVSPTPAACLNATTCRRAARVLRLIRVAGTGLALRGAGHDRS
jgi:hypothetical protein